LGIRAALKGCGELAGQLASKGADVGQSGTGTSGLVLHLESKRLEPELQLSGTVGGLCQQRRLRLRGREMVG